MYIIIYMLLYTHPGWQQTSIFIYLSLFILSQMRENVIKVNRNTSRSLNKLHVFTVFWISNIFTQNLQYLKLFNENNKISRLK